MWSHLIEQNLHPHVLGSVKKFKIKLAQRISRRRRKYNLQQQQQQLSIFYLKEDGNIIRIKVLMTLEVTRAPKC